MVSSRHVSRKQLLWQAYIASVANFQATIVCLNISKMQKDTDQKVRVLRTKRENAVVDRTRDMESTIGRRYFVF